MQKPSVCALNESFASELLPHVAPCCTCQYSICVLNWERRGIIPPAIILSERSAGNQSHLMYFLPIVYSLFEQARLTELRGTNKSTADCVTVTVPAQSAQYVWDYLVSFCTFQNSRARGRKFATFLYCTFDTEWFCNQKKDRPFSASQYWHRQTTPGLFFLFCYLVFQVLHLPWVNRWMEVLRNVFQVFH